jgi:ribulose-5-phosphate 4-epimerase/fuculose-1-phosphate aldolase
MKELYSEKILTDIGGNLSFKEPNEEKIWITPSGLQKNLVEPEHLIQLDFNGEVIQDITGRGPSVETPMHLAIYQEDEDFETIIHSHAPYATAYSLIENPPEIPLLTAELTYLIPEIIVVPYAQSGSSKLGKEVAEALLECGIVILENHGVVAASDSFDKAAHKTRALEECLKLYLLTKKFERKIRPFEGFEDF